MAEIPLDPKIIKEEIAKVKERIKEYKDYGRRGNKEDIENAKEIYEDLQEQLKELNEQLKQSQTKPAKPKVEPKQAAAKRMITDPSGKQLSFSDYLKGLLGGERGAVEIPPWLVRAIDRIHGPREEDVMKLKKEVEGMDPRPRDQGAIADDPLTPEEAKRVKNYENIVQRNIEAERQRQILEGNLEPRNAADRGRLERQANRRARQARQAAAEQALIDAEEVEAVKKAMQRVRNKMLRGDLGTADALQKGRPRRTLTPEQRREMIRRTNLPQTERPYGSAIDDAIRRIAEEQSNIALYLQSQGGKPDLRLVPDPLEVTDDMFIAGGPDDPPKWMQREMAEKAAEDMTKIQGGTIPKRIGKAALRGLPSAALTGLDVGDILGDAAAREDLEMMGSYITGAPMRSDNPLSKSEIRNIESILRAGRLPQVKAPEAMEEGEGFFEMPMLGGAERTGKIVTSGGGVGVEQRITPDRLLKYKDYLSSSYRLDPKTNEYVPRDSQEPISDFERIVLQNIERSFGPPDPTAVVEMGDETEMILRNLGIED